MQCIIFLLFNPLTLTFCHHQTISIWMSYKRVNFIVFSAHHKWANKTQTHKNEYWEKRRNYEISFMILMVKSSSFLWSSPEGNQNRKNETLVKKTKIIPLWSICQNAHKMNWVQVLVMVTTFYSSKLKVEWKFLLPATHLLLSWFLYNFQMKKSNQMQVR